MTSQSISISYTILTVLSELIGQVTELDNLSGAHESEIEGICEQHNIFALIVLETDLLELIDVPAHALELRGGVLNAGLNWVVEGGREAGSLGYCED